MLSSNKINEKNNKSNGTYIPGPRQENLQIFQNKFNIQRP